MQSSYQFNNQKTCSNRHHGAFLFFVPIFLLFFFVIRGAFIWPFLIFFVIVIILTSNGRYSRSGYYTPRNSSYLNQNNNFTSQTTKNYQISYCKNCGSYIEKDSLYCSECGQRI